MAFAVLVTAAVPEHVRGYLGRFLVESAAGVFVGTLSPRVVDGLWRRVTEAADNGSATLVISDPTTEQGFQLLTNSAAGRQVVDFDGLALVANPTHVPPADLDKAPR